MSQSELDAVFDRQIEVAFGRSAEDKEWRSVAGTFENLLTTKFGDFRVGPKDGAAMTQGPLAGLQRKAKAVKWCDLVMLDHDTGETMDEVESAIAQKGLFAILWHTHSHMKPQSEIPESKLVMFLRKSPDWIRARTPSPNADTLIEQCRAYLEQEKKINGAITKSITAVTRTLTAKGVVFTVNHDPMPRVRSLFVLDTPFDFASRGTQDEAIAEWKDRYAGLSTALGLPYDASCVDPSRLMFLPARPRDSDVEMFEIRQVDGRMLTLVDMPRLTELSATKAADDRRADPFSAFDEVAPEKQTTWKTPGFRQWLAKHANDFEIEGFLETHGLENRGATTTGTCFECPTAELHTNGNDPADRGFWAQNASEREGGFACSCSHASCKTAAQAVTGKVDRAWFVDEFCARIGLGVEDLLEFCPNYNAAEDDRIEGEAKTVDAIESMISGLTRTSSVDDIIAVLNLMTANPSHELRNVVRLERIKEATGKGIRTLRSQLDALRTEIAMSATGGGGGDDGNDIGVDNIPPPEDGADAALIWAHWGYSDMVRCVRERLIARNEAEPTIFSRREGGYCRRAVIDGRSVFRDMKKDCDWVNVLTKLMRFMKPQTQRAPEQEVGPFNDAVTSLMGTQDLPFGVIDRVVQVPVFNEEGGLRTEPGYDPKGATWLDPKVSFREVPDVIEPEHLEEALYWLNEMYVDFPFSDSYTTGDRLPIKLDERDDDNHPKPNPERGRAARANTLSMLLLPFARALIDGPTPVYFIDKPAAGTGAGFLADTLGYTLYGHKMPAQTIPESEEELRKQITATLREGEPAIFLDNLNHNLKSGALASALTTGVFKGRILGLSEMVSIPIRSTWIIAANNGRLSHELMRRVVPIRLDAGVPNPAADRDPDSYKYDLRQFCIGNREQIVWSCHVLIRNWVQQGMKRDTRAVIQTFEDWSAVMGGILTAAGIQGFLGNVKEYLRERGEEVADESNFIQRLYDGWQGERFDVDAAFQACLMMGTVDKIDPDLNLELNGRDESGLRRSLGAKMGQMVGKTFRLQSGKTVSLGRDTKPKKTQFWLDERDVGLNEATLRQAFHASRPT